MSGWGGGGGEGESSSSWLGWFWRHVVGGGGAAARYGSAKYGGHDWDWAAYAHSSMISHEADGCVSVCRLPSVGSSPPSSSPPLASPARRLRLSRRRVPLLDAAELLPLEERRRLRFEVPSSGAIARVSLALQGGEQGGGADGGSAEGGAGSTSSSSGGGALAQQLLYALAVSARQDEIQALVVEARAALAALLRAGRLGLFDGAGATAAKAAGVAAAASGRDGGASCGVGAGVSSGGVVIPSIDHVHVIGAVREGTWTVCREALSRACDVATSLLAAARNNNGNGVAAAPADGGAA